jgi:TusA-related sulfurtransferase
VSARTVDALGLWCPVPVHLLARAVSAAAPGESVVLLADDPLIAIDLPAWCHSSGNALVSLEEDAGEWRAVVRRAAATG